jgi:hypothetical protein
MIFIPHECEPLSDWLDRKTRELFPDEFPREVTDSDIDGFLMTHPKGANSLIGAARSSDERGADGAVLKFDGVSSFAVSKLGPAYASPLLAEGFRAVQTETDKALLDHRSIARSVLESEREKKHAALKQRMFFGHYRDEFYHGTLKGFIVGADGSKQEIPARAWGSDEVATIIASCEFEGRPILIPRSDGAAKTSGDNEERKALCKKHLIDQVTKSPGQKTTTKKRLGEDFKLKGRSVNTIWNEVFETPPYSNHAPAWTQPGPPQTRSKP